MKKIMFLVAMITCLIACTPKNDLNHAKNIDLVKAYVKAVEEMNFNAMKDYLADDYLGMGPSYGDSIRKTEAVENWKWNVKNLYEKIHYNRSRFASVTIPDGENRGEWVANWAELTIVYKNDMGSATIWANTNYLLKDGKIVKSITFYNEADVIKQLGYKIIPPGMGD